MPVAIICGFCSETVRQMNKWQTIEPLVEMQAVFLCAKGAWKNRKVFYHLRPSWCCSVKKVQRKTIIPLWALRSYVRCLWLILQPRAAHSFYGPLFFAEHLRQRPAERKNVIYHTRCQEPYRASGTSYDRFFVNLIKKVLDNLSLGREIYSFSIIFA